MPLKLILHNPRAGLILGNFIGAIIQNAVTFNIPLYFQAVLLESATNSGLRLVVPTLCSSAVGTATGFLITWTRRLKFPLQTGTIFLVIGTTSLSLMQRGLPDWSFLLFLIPSNVGIGFMFPSTFMSVLAVSDQSEQAVVTSTLILWRSLGMVLGVASSSLVLQNALFIYLNEKVTGPEKDEVRKAPTAPSDSSSKLTCIIDHSKRPQIRQGHRGPGAHLPRAGHRRLRVIIEGRLHHGSHPLRHHRVDHRTGSAPPTRPQEEVSERAGERTSTALKNLDCCIEIEIERYKYKPKASGHISLGRGEKGYQLENL
jgi:predicted branched-subunit amino acid permease